MTTFIKLYTILSLFKELELHKLSKDQIDAIVEILTNFFEKVKTELDKEVKCDFKIAFNIKGNNILFTESFGEFIVEFEITQYHMNIYSIHRKNDKEKTNILANELINDKEFFSTLKFFPEDSKNNNIATYFTLLHFYFIEKK